MVRTGGVRVSFGRSSKSKKVGGSSAPTASTSSSKSGGSSTKLPPIPHQETPTWQKPITNFFKSDNLEKKTVENENVHSDNNEIGPSDRKSKSNSSDSENEEEVENFEESEVSEAEKNKENDNSNEFIVEK